MQALYINDDPQKIAQDAMALIHEHGLLPTPKSYELWYFYVAKMSHDLIAAVDEVLAHNGGKITDEQCNMLHMDFLENVQQEQVVKSAGELIQQTIYDMSDVIRTTKSLTSEYATSLDGLSQHLNKREDLGQVVRDIKKETHDIIDQNRKLETTLDKSSRIIVNMHDDLERVKREALTDSLTDIGNRKRFDQELSRMIDESVQEADFAFSLVLIDIDRFKDFNDQYGHQVGDQVLKLVARTLKDGLKGRDIACRYGGEEFVLLLPETNVTGAERVADLLRRAVEKKEIVNRVTGKVIAKITFSAGVTQYISGENTIDFIDRADRALYLAKKRGRNRIVVGDPTA